MTSSALSTSVRDDLGWHAHVFVGMFDGLARAAPMPTKTWACHPEPEARRVERDAFRLGTRLDGPSASSPCCSSLSGCGRVFGPEDLPSASIRGRIHSGGRPVGVRFLEITPTDGTLGVLRTAPVAPDGSFRADGVAAGSVGIKLAGPPLARTGDARIDQFLYEARRQYLIRRDLLPERNPPLDIDLQTERDLLEARLRPRSLNGSGLDRRRRLL